MAETVGAKAAFDIARSLLACALEDAKHWPGPVILSPSSHQDIEWAQNLIQGRSDLHVIAQPEGNLGERINRVDQKLRQLGHVNIITIGTDAPILGGHIFTQVQKELVDSDIVLSAAEDGGVTVMASSVPWPDIKNLPWSTDRLGQALHDECCDKRLSVAFVDPSYDIDLEGDLLKLITDLKDDERPARQQLLHVVVSLFKEHKCLERVGVE